MKISKYIHSCILLEEGGEKLLIDPGMFTFAEGVSPSTFKGVQTIVLTHNHPDHIDLANLKKILKDNKATIVTNKEIKKVLTIAGVTTPIITDVEYATENFVLHAIPAAHELILADQLPENTAYRINDSILTVGDSFAEQLTKEKRLEVLLLPAMAPWCTEVAVFEFAKKIKPKRIIPVHDGYAKDFFVKSRNQNYQKQFEKLGIEYVALEKPGASIKI